MTQIAIDLPQPDLDRLCRENSVVRMRLFGSVLRDDFGPDSDVDVLVEFAPGKTPGLEFFQLQEQLSEVLGKPVDLHTPAGLSRYFRDEVIAEAETVYDAS
jgi:hypothetical protein